MKGLLIFCKSKSESIALAYQMPMALPCTGPGHIEDAIRHLAAGHTVCADIMSISAGWRAPEGTTILFTAEAVMNTASATLWQAIARNGHR